VTAEAAESELWIEEREFGTVKPKSQLQEARSQNRGRGDREARIVAAGTVNSEL